MEARDVEKKAHDLGFEYEGRYRGCAQCTIAAVQDALGCRDDAVFRSASSLAAGMAKLCDGPCGGYTGGAMMISSFWGRTRDKFDDDLENRARCDRLTKALHDSFVEEYGSVICREIHEKLFGRSFDMSDAKDLRVFDEMGAHVDKCTAVVAKAAGMTARLIAQELEGSAPKRG